MLWILLGAMSAAVLVVAWRVELSALFAGYGIAICVVVIGWLLRGPRTRPNPRWAGAGGSDPGRLPRQSLSKGWGR